MDVQTLSLLFIISFVLLLGFAGQIIFRRTNIPDVLWLLLLGIVLSLFITQDQRGILAAFAGPFGTLALVMILFNCGEDFDLIEFSKGIGRGFLLTAFGFVSTVIATTLFTTLALGWPLLYGVLLGVILGDASQAVTIPIITRLRVPEKLKSILTIETTLTDIFVIVVAIAVIQMIATGSTDALLVFRDIVAPFAIGVTVALMGAFAWLFAAPRIEREINSHFLTFVVVLLLYVFTEFIGGSGAFTALIFGLALGNISLLRQVARLPDDVVFTKTEREFHSELNFFIRTFFFVYLGVIFSFSDLLPIAIGAVLVAVFLAMRIISSRLALIGSGLAEAEKNLTAVLMSRGLTAAVVAQMPAAALAAVAITEPAKGIIASIPQITLSVIFLSIAVTVAGVYFVSKPMNGEAPEAKRTGPAKAKKA